MTISRRPACSCVQLRQLRWLPVISHATTDLQAGVAYITSLEPRSLTGVAYLDDDILPALWNNLTFSAYLKTKG